MPVLDRSLSVMLDGEPFSFSGRMRLRGEDELSLFPALFTLEIWNLPEEYFLRLFRAKKISVSHGDACLVSGTISDVFRRPAQEGILTTVAISLGLDLWESVVSLSVPAGTLLSDAVRQILMASGTGIPLLSVDNGTVLFVHTFCPGHNPSSAGRRSASQKLFHVILSAAKNLPAPC